MLFEPEVVSGDEEAKSRLLRSIISWPPDLFAFTSVLLEDSGAYKCIVSPKSGKTLLMEDWSKEVDSCAKEWRRRLDALDYRSATGNPELASKQLKDELHGAVPELLKGPQAPGERAPVWPLLTGRFGDVADKHGIYHLCDEDQPSQLIAIVFLHAVADEACDLRGELATTPFAIELRSRGAMHGSFATCSTDRARVLPKSHTPQVGIALRSLSQHLAYSRSHTRSSMPVNLDLLRDPGVETDENLDWLTSGGDDAAGADESTPDPERIRIMLLPWPYRITPDAFSVATYIGRRSEDYGMFDFRPPSDDALGVALDEVFAASKELGLAPDLLVLPELSIEDKSLALLEEKLIRSPVNGYLAGVLSSEGESAQKSNRLVYRSKRSVYRRGVGGEFLAEDRFEGVRQCKHHRWALNRYQLERYQLTSRLSPEKTWWENAFIDERELIFAQGGPGISIAPLICEDLARQDPVGDLIRAVGPSLVIALLMDGPQLANRWAARYATVLAEDPGSSVLTLTSAGMVDLWSARRQSAGRVVALWQEPNKPADELELAGGSLGILLDVEIDTRTEFTADGRSAKIPCLRLAGAHQLPTRTLVGGAR